MLEEESLRGILRTGQARLVRTLPDASRVCLPRVLPLLVCSSGS